MNIRDLIPKDKFDIKTAEKLHNFSFAEIKPIIPDLLEWIQDMNWPVSRPVAEYLKTITDEVNPDILKILRGDDDMWKYWTIGVFGCVTKDTNVLAEIRRIATNPTKGEIECEVNQQAVRFLGERTD